MEKWYLNKLYEETDQPTLRFAFQGTVNWMRALAISVGDDFSNTVIKEFYKEVRRREYNKKSDLIVFENILMAIHNLHSLQEVNKNIDNPYSIARTQIVSWYYTIYYASSAMIGAFSGTIQETHSMTAKVWHTEFIKIKKNLVMYPFDLSLDTLVEKDVKTKIQNLRNGNSNTLNNTPTNIIESHGAMLSYLQGTAKYKKWTIEEEVKKSKDFKELNVDNFRTKKARELRDKKLEKGIVNFLVQSFRCRGKAHYRDSVFLSYGDDRTDDLKQFIDDLEIVATAFLKMSAQYTKMRVKEKDWDIFLSDLENNLRFDFDINILKG
ncbi:MAG: hypothetical protein LGB06_07790 [Sulfurovum sp.]|nr:hypothetical protein [Sulfurovum sp.]